MALPALPLTPENVAATTASASRQPAAAQGATPFSQVLSEEISQLSGIETVEAAATTPTDTALAPAAGLVPVDAKAAQGDAAANTASDLAMIDTTGLTAASPELLAIAYNLGLTVQKPAESSAPLTAEPKLPENVVQTARPVTASIDAAQLAAQTQLPEAAPQADAETALPKVAEFSKAAQQSSAPATLEAENRIAAEIGKLVDLANPAQPEGTGKPTVNFPQPGLQQTAAEPQANRLDITQAQPQATPSGAAAPAQALSARPESVSSTIAEQPMIQTAAAEAQPDMTAEIPPAPASNPASPVQQTRLDPAPMQGAVAHYRLAPEVGTQGWNHALGQRINWMVAGAEQMATLTLNPPDLGPLQVVLSVTNDQASASFYSAQPEVRQAVEAALPRLRDMMSDAGVQLGQATVSADLPRQNDSDRQPRQAGPHFGRYGNSTDSPKSAEVPVPVRAGLGLVDTYA